MNNREKAVSREFPSAIDAAINKRFGKGTKAESRFDIFLMEHVTAFRAKGAKKKEIEAFIEGWTAGNVELRERLLALTKKNR